MMEDAVATLSLVAKTASLTLTSKPHATLWLVWDLHLNQMCLDVRVVQIWLAKGRSYPPLDYKAAATTSAPT